MSDEDQKKLSPAQRAKLIRKGNELFNKKQYEKAAKVFWLTNYKDGLIRIGEHLLYNEKKPFQALLYYQKINHKEKVNEILGRTIWALEKLIKQK